MTTALHMEKDSGIHEMECPQLCGSKIAIIFLLTNNLMNSGTMI
jgi:hypothetical protein